MYRWHRDYPLGAALSKVSGARVLERLRDFAADRGMPAHTRLSTEVETMQEAPSGDGCAIFRPCSCSVWAACSVQTNL